MSGEFGAVVGRRGRAEIERPVWSGARSTLVRSLERPPLSIFEFAAQSFEGSFLGYDRPVGVREKARERPISLAEGGRHARQNCTKSRGVCDAAGWNRSCADAASAMVSQARRRGIRKLTNSRINTA